MECSFILIAEDQPLLRNPYLPWHIYQNLPALIFNISAPPDPEADALLLLQPDRAVPADRQHGRVGVYPPARQRGEALTRWAVLE